MFFPRLRRHAKWVFVFLAVAFALGFVGFGVGAGGIGFGDILRGYGGSSGVPSVSEARKRVSENPKDAQAFRDLATALQTEGETDEAIEALESYAGLRPKDADALRELAGLYLAQAAAAQQRAQLIQLRANYLAGASTVTAGILLDGRPLTPDAITNAVSTVTEGELTTALVEAQDAARKAVDTYKRIAAAAPADPNVQLELAQAAESARDIPTAIKAYERFLKLAPDDATAPLVRRQLKQLRSLQSG